MSENKKLVAIVMGSDSDWPVMKFAAQMLADLMCLTKPRSFQRIEPQI